MLSECGRLLAHELENFVAAFAEWQSQAVPILERVRDDIDFWPVDQFDFIQVRRDIKGHTNADAMR